MNTNFRTVLLLCSITCLGFTRPIRSRDRKCDINLLFYYLTKIMNVKLPFDLKISAMTAITTARVKIIPIIAIFTKCYFHHLFHDPVWWSNKLWVSSSQDDLLSAINFVKIFITALYFRNCVTIYLPSLIVTFYILISKWFSRKSAKWHHTLHKFHDHFNANWLYLLKII